MNLAGSPSAGGAGTSAVGRWLAANPSAISVTVGLVIVVALVLSKMRGHELQPRRRIVWPVVILVAGVAVVAPQLAHSPSPRAIDFVVGGLDLVLSLALGTVRGLTVKLSLRDGAWWYRYGLITVALWALTIAARFALGWYGSSHGTMPAVASGSVLFMLGLSLLSQNLTVLARAAAAPPGAIGRRSGAARQGHESTTTSTKGYSR